MILRGGLLGLLHVIVFLTFYSLGFLPEERFFLLPFNIMAFGLMSFVTIKYVVLQNISNYFRLFFSLFLFLTCSSFITNSFDYIFHSKIDADYKYILAEQRVEKINERRSRNGVGVYESVDKEKIGADYTFRAVGISFFTSSIFNLFYAVVLSVVALFIFRNKNPSNKSPALV